MSKELLAKLQPKAFSLYFYFFFGGKENP